MPSERNAYFRYLPVSPMDQAWGLYVLAAGVTRLAPNTPYPPSGHPAGYDFTWRQGRVLGHFAIVYITRGSGVLETRTKAPRQIRAGDAFLLFPEVWHRYAPHARTGWDEKWLVFDGDYARRLQTQGFLTTDLPVIHGGLDEMLIQSHAQIMAQVKAQPIGYQQVIAALAQVMLARLLAAARAKASGGNRAEEVVRAASGLMVERLAVNLDMRDLARELHVSYSWFRQVFTKHTGLSPYQYHLQIRMNRARQLLTETGLAIKEVADELGFNDYHYFCRVFRHKTRHTPNGWRSYSRGGS